MTVHTCIKINMYVICCQTKHEGIVCYAAMSMMPPKYQSEADWNEELERLKVKGFRAVQLNTGFRASER